MYRGAEEGLRGICGMDLVSGSAVGRRRHSPGPLLLVTSAAESSAVRPEGRDGVSGSQVRAEPARVGEAHPRVAIARNLAFACKVDIDGA